jgi:hypothetical protein
MTNMEFLAAVSAYVETLAPAAGPWKIITFEHNATSDTTKTALVLVWVGIGDNTITKNVYKVWFTAGVLTKALVAKSEWPIEATTVTTPA